MATIGMLLIGLVSGVLGGMLGIGGGVIVIPALVYVFGMSQQMSQGTTLAMMLPPIGAFAAFVYWKNGFVNWQAAALICVGFLIGGYFGAKIAMAVPTGILKKLFGVFLLILSLQMMFGPSK
jgi:uncharacterized membrane protein YfcA